MARVRSPNYPALSLPQAITAVAKVFAKENRHRADKDVVVKAMGYSGVNGASLGSLSALLKYGLLEQLKDGGYKVTERTLAILHPQSPQEKAEAIKAAAQEPALFAEMLSDFPGSIPSDDNLRSYLVRRGFSPGALSAVINAYRETMSLAGGEGDGYDSGVLAGEAAAAPVGVSTVHATAAPITVPLVITPPAIAGGDPFRLGFSPSGGLEGSFRLNSADDLDDLVTALTGMKFIFKKMTAVKTPDADSDGSDG